MRQLLENPQEERIGKEEEDEKDDESRLWPCHIQKISLAPAE